MFSIVLSSGAVSFFDIASAKSFDDIDPEDEFITLDGDPRRDVTLPGI